MEVHNNAMNHTVCTCTHTGRMIQREKNELGMTDIIFVDNLELCACVLVSSEFIMKVLSLFD